MPVFSQGLKWCNDPLMHSTSAGSSDRHCLMYGAAKRERRALFNEKNSSKMLFGSRNGFSISPRNKSWISILRHRQRASTAKCTQHTATFRRSLRLDIIIISNLFLRDCHISSPLFSGASKAGQFAAQYCVLKASEQLNECNGETGAHFTRWLQ